MSTWRNMFTIDTEFYDLLELLLKKYTTTKRFAIFRKKSDNDKRTIALTIVNETLVNIVQVFIKDCAKASENEDLAEDARALRQRMFDSLSSLDEEKLASLDEKYITRAVKEAIDAMASPSEIELAMVRYGESSKIWEVMFSCVRQLQTFFEAKVTFENYPL